MNKKRKDKKGFSMGKKILLCFLLLIAASYGFSSSLSFQIVQHNDSLNSVCQSAYVIEDEILNYFFDNGFIVSNAQAGISDSSEQDKKLWCDGYYEASDGCFDDFVQIHIYFGKAADKDEKIALGLIDRISWNITSIRTGKTLEASDKTVKKPMGNDSEANVREFAVDFASHIKQVIKNRV